MARDEQIMGAISGSKATPEAPAGLRPSGFDPARIEKALRAADDALRNHACHGGPKAPCLRSPEQCRYECGKLAGDALLKVEAALQSLAAK